jgi:FkbM family methyltransferase
MSQLTIEQAMQVAVNHHQAGRLQDAELIYRKILAIQPKHADSLHLLGVIAGNAGRDDLAADLVRQAIAAAPDNPHYHLTLGLLAQKKGRGDEAIACYQRAVALKPDFAQAHTSLSDALFGGVPPHPIYFAQEGEDAVLQRHFEYQPPGFYVDVGAYHPYRFSNTFFFYRLGWRGINIDATPGSMTEFHRLRPRDINIEAAVSDKVETLTSFIFNDGALNTFDPALAAKRDGDHGSRLVQRVPITTVTMAELLSRHLPPGTPINFLSVDVEGLELQVLRSNDWNRYRPSIILAEDFGVNRCRDIDSSETAEFLAAQGYEAFAKTIHTIFYRLNEPADRAKS